jgi:hypothetical protein
MDAGRRVESSPSSENGAAAFRRQQRIALVVLGLVLLGLAVALVLIGVGAIEDQVWTVTGEATRSAAVGPIGVREHDQLAWTWDGGDAQRAGAGLACLGAMLGVWALGCFTSAVNPSIGERPGVCAVGSATLYGLGIVLLVPPTSVAHSASALAFWLSVLVWVAAIALSIRRQASAWRIVMPAFVGTLAAALLFGGEAAAAGILGLFATLGVCAHALYVYPPWRRWAMQRERSRG